MARTKARVLADHLSRAAEQRGRGVAKPKRGLLNYNAARMRSTPALAKRPDPEPERARSVFDHLLAVFDDDGQATAEGCGSRASVTPAASGCAYGSDRRSAADDLLAVFDDDGEASVAPAASGCAYGSDRRSAAAAEEAHELEKDGWADEARGSFREHEGRRALVDGNARSCGQDALVAVATALGVKASKDAVRAATLPPEGDTPVGTIRSYAASTLGISMRSLKDHSVLGHSLWELPGGADHQLLLLEAGMYYTELKITMPKTEPAATAKATPVRIEPVMGCSHAYASPSTDRAASTL